MSFRTWMYVFALGLTLATSGQAQDTDSALEQEPVAETGDGDTRSDRNDRANAYIANSDEILSTMKGIEAAIRDLVAEEDKIEADRERDQESRDLNAQESMASWAKWMFWATLGTVGVTLVGLVLIGFTLNYTRIASLHTEKMLDQAKMTTDAAHEANRIQKNSMRPVVELTEVDSMFTPNVSGVVVSLNPVWKNVGKTTAVGVNMYVSWRTIDAKSNDFEIPKIDIPPDRGIIAPDKEMIGLDFLLNAREFGAVSSQQKDIILFSVITYGNTDEPGIPTEKTVLMRGRYIGAKQNNDGTREPMFVWSDAESFAKNDSNKFGIR